MALILTTEAMRVVKRNERGNVIFRKVYRRYDEVNPEHLEEGRVEALLAAGSLVDTSEAVDWDAMDDGEDVDPAEEDGGSPEPSADEESANGEEPADDEKSAGGGSTEELDRYDSMSYADLQNEAKQRTGNGGGSAEELRVRLREADANQ